MIVTNLRMPPELREWVKSKADNLDRSMNWFMVNILKEAKQRDEEKQNEAT